MSPEKLVDVGPSLPGEIKSRVGQLTRDLEPYEDFAGEFGQGPIGEKLALVEILEQGGVISPAFAEKFTTLARALSNVPASFEEKFYSAPDAQKPVLKKRLEAQADEYNRSTTKLTERIARDGRPLARNIFAEALHASIVFTLERRIKTIGFYAVWVKEKATNTHLHWISFADAIEKMPAFELPKTPNDFTTEEKFRLLKEAQFKPSGQFAAQLPYVAANNEHLSVVMQVSEKTNAATLINFAIPMDGLQLRGSLSRATGELHVSNAMLLSLKEHFRIAHAERSYGVLREMIIAALFDAWERGLISEEEYVTLDGKLDEIPPEEIVPSDTLVTSEDEDAATPQPTDAKSEILPGKEKKSRYSTRKFTWRRIMAALKRCGVEIDMGHAHPKLRYEGRTAGYLNSHDKDTRHNRQVLRDTLAKLQIPFDVFKEKLY